MERVPLHYYDPREWPIIADARFARWRSFVLNLSITLLLYETYDLSRGLIPRDGGVAISHAHAVWSWEVRHGLFVEPDWQQYWLSRAHRLGVLHLSPASITDFLNTGYLYVHFLGTIVFLFWLFFRRRAIFPFVRNVFFVTTGIALAVYILYPLAPPRLTPDLLYYNHPYVFVDTVRKVIDPSLQTSQIGYNPYAAMPSLHFGWALIIGLTLLTTLRPWPLRLLGACYPLFMLGIIVISGNHYFADALGSALVVLAATIIVSAWMGWRGALPWRFSLPTQWATWAG